MEQAHIYVYGVIDYWQDENASEWGYVNLKDIRNQYEAQSDCKEITVHIHSDGGVVTEGFAIHDYLRSLGKPINVIIEGTCASIATVIALAGDTRQMTSNANFMIHNPWGYVGGEKEQIQKYADELDKLENQIADFYASKTKLTKEEALDLMKVESTFSAEEALKHGFITSIETVMRAVALFNHNKKTTEMSKKNLTKKETESLIDKAAKSLAKALGVKAKPENKMVQDANGTEIDFPDLEDDATPKEGDKATVDGSPADGEYVMPSGETYVFASGELTEIKPEEEEEETEESEEVENLKTDLAASQNEVKNLKRQLKAEKAENKSLKKTMKAFQDDLDSVKRAVKSGFKSGEKTKKKNQGGEGAQTSNRRVWKEEE